MGPKDAGDGHTHGSVRQDQPAFDTLTLAPPV
jgi:hypothetical protein